MKSNKYLKTSYLARQAGIHPNTVRLYVDWGLIPPVERSPKGYRQFTQRHLDCLMLARLVFDGPYPGPLIRRSGANIIRKAAQGDLGGALELSYRHKALVQSEMAHAEAAADMLDRWAQGLATDTTRHLLLIGETAHLLGVSVDMLRNWERNGLIDIPRQDNGYRLFGAKEIGRLRVIRMLIRSGYSMMAILRMLLCLDAGQIQNLRDILDTPRPDEDIFSAADRWLSTLAAQAKRAGDIISRLEHMLTA